MILRRRLQHRQCFLPFYLCKIPWWKLRICDKFFVQVSCTRRLVQASGTHFLSMSWALSIKQLTEARTYVKLALWHWQCCGRNVYPVISNTVARNPRNPTAILLLCYWQKLHYNTRLLCCLLSDCTAKCKQNFSQSQHEIHSGWLVTFVMCQWCHTLKITFS